MTRKRTHLFFLTLIAVMFALAAVPPALKSNPQEEAVAVKHPIVSTPEKTLTTILSAYIDRDAKTVLAYVHPAIQKNPDRMARWSDMVQRLTTDRMHVLRIVEVRLVSVSTRRADRVATLVAKIERTPGFPGGKDVGNNVREYHWSLVQLGGKGPWYHDGGGF